MYKPQYLLPKQEVKGVKGNTASMKPTTPDKSAKSRQWFVENVYTPRPELSNGMTGSLEDLQKKIPIRHCSFRQNVFQYQFFTRAEFAEALGVTYWAFHGFLQSGNVPRPLFMGMAVAKGGYTYWRPVWLIEEVWSVIRAFRLLYSERSHVHDTTMEIQQMHDELQIIRADVLGRIAAGRLK